MIDATSKAILHGLAQIPALQRLASKYGMAPDTGFARRFIAGETIDEAVAAGAGLQQQGLLLTLDYLGESVTSGAAAAAAAADYVRIIGAIVQSGIERNLSIKLTQLGLDVDRATAVDNMRRILEPADANGFFVRIDMENSRYTDVTMEVFETLWQQEYRNVGLALQSALHRTERDVQRLIGLGARIRLVKGAYKEPASLAFPKKRDVDQRYYELAQRLLTMSPALPSPTASALTTRP